MAPRVHSLRIVDGIPEAEPLPGPVSVDTGAPPSPLKFEEGALKIEHPDGSVVIDLNPDKTNPQKDESDDFYRNLANEIDESELDAIATDLIDGIRRDEESRKEWMTTRARGITLLGLKLEDPTGGASESTAPLEGMSRVHHPLLLEATIRFQATARGELLPATGPVKIRNDSTIGPKPAEPLAPSPSPPGDVQQSQGMVPPGMVPPPPPALGHNGGPPLEEETSDELAQSLEKDMNHYLTVTAKEYIPDTDRMLFYIGFGGDGFKKVFNCPLRRRPVSESVDAEDLIVSNAATALSNCGRITHRIKMRKSVLKRMQIIGAYRDVELSLPEPPQPTEVENKKADIQGQSVRMIRPEDQDYEVLECYCELELDEFAPRKFKGEGLPLPYRVTIERTSQQVLSVIRNWDEDDEQALPKQFFVQFPFVRGLGFYGLGFIHILGNTTVALTALWRELIDSGMFANFPGFLYLKALGRQLTNQFRVAPGSGVGLDGAPGQDIRQMVMPLPYKSPDAAFTAFTAHMEEVGQRLGMTSQIEVGEGKQDAPVGTTLALIEQATKIMDSAHKRLHASQAEEFQLLKERFKEDPEAFWRHNKRPTKPWTKEQFLKAINDNDLVPVADPNNPTSLHRVAKAMAIKQLQKDSPNLYNPQAVDQRIFRIVGIDPEGLFNKQPAPDKPDPRLVAIQEKAKASQMQVELGQMQEKMRLITEQMKIADRAAERQSREKIAAMKQRLEETRLVIEQYQSSDDFNAENAHRMQELFNEQMRHARDLEADHIKHIRELDVDKQRTQHEMGLERATKEQELEHGQAEHGHEMMTAKQRHEQEMEHERQKHEQKMEHDRQLTAAKVEAAKKLAAIKKESKPAKSKGDK